MKNNLGITLTVTFAAAAIAACAPEEQWTNIDQMFLECAAAYGSIAGIPDLRPKLALERAEVALMKCEKIAGQKIHKYRVKLPSMLSDLHENVSYWNVLGTIENQVDEGKFDQAAQTIEENKALIPEDVEAYSRYVEQARALAKELAQQQGVKEEEAESVISPEVESTVPRSRADQFKPFVITSSKTGKEMTSDYIEAELLCKSTHERFEDYRTLLDEYDLVSSRGDSSLSITGFLGKQDGRDVVVYFMVTHPNNVLKWVEVGNKRTLRCER